MARHWVKELVQWGDLGRVLYVGAHGMRKRAPALLEHIVPASSAVDCLEIFPENVKRVGGYFDNVMLGDVREAVLEDGFAKYDTLVWWHGPEHVCHDEGEAVLTQIKSPRVWIGCPGGLSPQGVVYGNAHEQHVSQWQADEFRALGFDCQEYYIRGQLKLSAWRIDAD